MHRTARLAPPHHGADQADVDGLDEHRCGGRLEDALHHALQGAQREGGRKESTSRLQLTGGGPQEGSHALAHERAEDNAAVPEPAAEPRCQRREEERDDLLRHEDRSDRPMLNASVQARTREEGRYHAEGEVGERLGQDDHGDLEPLAMGGCARVAHLRRWTTRVAPGQPAAATKRAVLATIQGKTYV